MIDGYNFFFHSAFFCASLVIHHDLLCWFTCLMFSRKIFDYVLYEDDVHGFVQCTTQTKALEFIARRKYGMCLLFYLDLI